MTGRFVAVGILFSAALAFLLVFASGGVDATTFKIVYTGSLSCNGADGIAGNADDSCVPAAPPIGARAAGLTADMMSVFDIPGTLNQYSNFSILTTMGTPVNWAKLATDKEIPNGAYVGSLTSVSKLALFGGDCGTNLTIPFPMYDCTTANFEGVNDGCAATSTAESGFKCSDSLDNDGDTKVNDGCPKVGAVSESTITDACNNALDDDGDADPIIAWSLPLEGNNLVYGKKGGLPDGCTRYPQHLNNIFEGLKPRARYFGFSIPLAGMRPTQVEFLFFSTEEEAARGILPYTDMGDATGYINQVILDNPPAPTAPNANLDEFCTPLSSLTGMLGRTSGEGELNANVPPIPNPAGSFWTYTQDACGDGVDNDADTKKDEMCGIVRIANPAANTGVGGTGSHMVKAYGESYRDADGDTINNYIDECPLDDDTEVDDDDDHIANECDPNDTDGDQDPDDDTYRAQQDNCAIVNNPDQLDSDGDRIGDACDNNDTTPDGKFLNDFTVGSVCVGAVDTDDDGWCDATETALGSATNDNTKTPESYVVDQTVKAIENPPGAGPQTCTNYDYYDVNASNPADPHVNGAGNKVNDDGESGANASGDAGCTCPGTDLDCDGVTDGPGDNCNPVTVAGCAGANAYKCYNPTQLNTDGDALGDTCDSDDDQDKVIDTDEWKISSDPKNVCDPGNFDLNTTAASVGIINILDVLMFSNTILGKPCNAAVNYAVCERIYRGP